MDPANEQRLKEEVIYLHSLWHQGPPRTNPNPNPNPNIDTNPNRRISTYLRPAASRFKKQGKNNQNDPIKPPPPPPAFNQANVEWPCPPPPDPKPETYSAWPVLNLPPAKKTRLASAQEQARFVADKVQRKALKLAKDFFGNSGDSDDDDDSEDEDDDMEEEEESEEYSLLMRIFIQDREFRAYYEKNYGNGEFSCLVCAGIGQKIGKRYKDCVALVQHSTSIAKTKKKKAHRAYGRAICKVLGWDIKQLPTIISSLTKPEDSQGNVDDGNMEHSNNLKEDGNSVNFSEKAGGDGELMVCEKSQTEVDGNQNMETLRDDGHSVTVVNIDSNVGENLSEKAVDLANGEMMICENSQTEVDANKKMENFEHDVLNTVEPNADVVVNHLQSLEDGADGNNGGHGIKDDLKDYVVVETKN